MEGVPTSFTFPARAERFPPAANLLIETPAEGRAAALAVLQASMFRLLTSLPPGQVRFTIVDPIGIGRSFGAFMHLADFDGALVTNQVWTDPRQIEERLADLAAHMETVTQKYLRNEYATHRGVQRRRRGGRRALPGAGRRRLSDQVRREVGRPAGRDRRRRRALRRVDPDRRRSLQAAAARLPARRAAPLLRHLDLGYARPQLAWDDRDFGQYPLALDPPPAADFATRQIQKVGAAAKDAKRVEVPFEFISPPDGRVVDARQPRRASTSRSARPARPSASTSRSATAPRSTS